MKEKKSLRRFRLCVVAGEAEAAVAPSPVATQCERYTAKATEGLRLLLPSTGEGRGQRKLDQEGRPPPDASLSPFSPQPTDGRTSKRGTVYTLLSPTLTLLSYVSRALLSLPKSGEGNFSYFVGAISKSVAMYAWF